MKKKHRMQMPKRLLSLTLAALLAMSSITSLGVYAAEEEETLEETDAEKAETDDSVQEKTDVVSSEETQDNETLNSEVDLTAETYGDAATYTGAWSTSNFKAGTYTVTANLSMPGEYNPVLTGITVYANNPNNPFGPVLDANDPAENVENSAPTTPLSNNATLVVAEDGTVTLTLPIKNPVFTTQKLGTSENLAFTAEKLAGPYKTGTGSVDSRIYKLTATLGKVDLNAENVATYTFKGSQLYAVPINTTLAPDGDVALQLDVDFSHVTKTLVPEISECTYTGMEQTAIAESELYTVTAGEAKATDAGKYSATLTLTEAAKTAGYAWKNSDTDSITVDWELKKAELTASYTGETIESGEVPSLTVEVSGFVNDENAETAADYKAPAVTAPENLEEGKSYELTPSGGEAKNYNFNYSAGTLNVSAVKEVVKSDTYTITANLTIKGENNQVLPGVQIYPGTNTFPPCVAGSMNAKLVVTENNERYITLSFPVKSADSAGAEEIFTLQSIGDGTNIHVVDTKKAAGMAAPYSSEYPDRIVEVTFKVDEICDEYTLGESVEYPTILEMEVNMQLHLLVDWDSAVRAYADPEDGEDVWTKTYTDEATGVVMTVSTTEKAVGEKLETAVFTVDKEESAENLSALKSSIENKYNGSFTLDAYGLSLKDKAGVEIALDGNTKAEISFTTDAESTADIYRYDGADFEDVNIRQAVSEGKISCSVTEKIGTFVVVDSSEAYRWFNYTYTESATNVSSTIYMSNGNAALEYMTCASYSTKITERENGDKEYSFAIASPVEPMFGPTPLQLWEKNQFYMTMEIPAEEGTSYYLVADDGEHTNVQPLEAEIKDGQAILTVMTKDYENDGNELLKRFYYRTRETEGKVTAYILATKSEAKFASQPTLDGATYTYNGKAQTGYIKGEHYVVVSGNESETDAGEYTLTVKPEEGYVWLDGTSDEVEFKWSIKKKKLNLQTNYNKAYLMDPGSIPTEIEYSISGFVNGESEETAADYVAPSVSMDGLTSSDLAGINTSGRNNIINASHILSNGSAKNYSFNINGTVDIYTKIAEWPDNVQEPAVYTYTGEEQSDGIQGAFGNFFKKSGTTKATDAGVYTTTLTLQKHYTEVGGTWPDGTTDPISVTWEIKPATLTATYVSETIDRNETPELKVEVEGFVNDETAETAADYAAPAVTAPTTLNTRTYTLSPKGGSAKNYTFVYKSGKLKVKKTTRFYTSLAGTNRYATAVDIAKEAYPNGADTVILVKGTDFPDALAANAYAGVLNAPILLNGLDTLNDNVKDLLNGEWKGTVKKVIILGKGMSAAVTESLENECNVEVEMVAGDNRYETAIKIAEETVKVKATDTVFVATGMKAADATSASSWSYANGYPILLADKSGNLKQESIDFIKDNGIQNVILLGSESVVSDECACGVDFVRLGGINRYETSVKIASYFSANTDGSLNDNVGFAHGGDDHFPDALVGGQLMAKYNTGIILVNGSNEAVSTFVEDNMAGTISKGSTFYFLGYAAKGKSDVYDKTIEVIESKD